MNTRRIFEAIDILKKKKKKCSTVEVLKMCQQECDTVEEELIDAIDSIVKIGLIERKGVAPVGDSISVTFHNHSVSILDFVESKFSKVKDELLSSFTRLVEDKLADYLEFKKFIHAEVLDLKSKVSSRIASSSPQKSQSLHYEKAFIKSIEQRIFSLEKQLDQKQMIINNYWMKKSKWGSSGAWRLSARITQAYKKTKAPFQIHTMREKQI